MTPLLTSEGRAPLFLSFFLPRLLKLRVQVIRNHPTSLDIYKKKLIDSKVLSPSEVAAMEDRVYQILNEEYNNSKNYVPSTRDWLAAYWSGFKSPEQLSRIRNTG